MVKGDFKGKGALQLDLEMDLERKKRTRSESGGRSTTLKTRKRKYEKKEKSILVSDLYMHVVDDVISKVQSEFHADGVDDKVLDELQATWEHKLMQSGAVQEGTSHESPEVKPIPQPAVSGPPVHDLHAPPYAVKEEPDVTPKRSAAKNKRMKPRTGSRRGARRGSRKPVMAQHIPSGPSEESVSQSSDHHLSLTLGIGTPSSYMQQPASLINQKRPGVELDLNETYEERDEGDIGPAQLTVTVQGVPAITDDFRNIATGKRKYDDISSGYNIPQRDGATDVAADDEL